MFCENSSCFGFVGGESALGPCGTGVPTAPHWFCFYVDEAVLPMLDAVENIHVKMTLRKLIER